VRVVIVADVRLYRDGLTATLSVYPSLDVIGSASSPAEALSLIQTARPEVTVIDMAMPGSFSLLRSLRSEASETRPVAFAIDEDVTTIIECAEAGAAGYVPVDASIDDLAHAIRRAAAGELLCPPRVAAELFRRIADVSDRRVPAGDLGAELTCREREVLDLLRPGFSNKAIASALNISQSTVKNHVHHLLEKLQVGSRQQAAAHAAERASRKRRTQPRG
jgi:DNA-binding NarL/FixJ family response regulator